VIVGTVTSYFAALRAIHTDLSYDERPFDSLCLRRIVQGAVNLFPAQPRAERTPISRNLLLHLVSPAATASENALDALAVNAAFTLAFAAFLRMGEFTYPSSGLADRRRLEQEFLTPLRIKLAPDHLLLVLPRSKTDKFNQGITISIARVGDSAYAGTHMQKWLAARRESKWPPLRTPLFEFAGSLPFKRERVVAVLRHRLINIGEPPSLFAGHSFLPLPEIDHTNTEPVTSPFLQSFFLTRDNFAQPCERIPGVTNSISLWNKSRKTQVSQASSQQAGPPCLTWQGKSGSRMACRA
jgi:hypothetical protein